MNKELCDAIAQICYETEEHIPEDDEGFAWRQLHPVYKAHLTAHVELVVNTYQNLTTKRYEALSAEEIAVRVRECEAHLRERETVDET